MYRRLSVAAACALSALVGCSNRRDLGNLPDGGGGTTGTAGTAGSGAAGQGGAAAGVAGTGGDGGGGIAGSSSGGGEGGIGGASAGAGAAGTTGGGTGGVGGTGGTGGSGRRCDSSKPFGAPTVVPNINSPSNEEGAELADDLTLYLVSLRPGGVGSWDIYVATRNTPSSAFSAPQLALGINGPATELWPRLTNGQLTMFYVYAPNNAPGHIYVTSRSSVSTAFAPGAALAQVNSTGDDGDPYPWRDGAALYFTSGRPGGIGVYDIYVALRRADGSYGTPDPVSELNTSSTEVHPVVTEDGLTIYFGSNRGTGAVDNSLTDIWRGTRSSTAEPFGNLAKVDELNSTATDAPNWISPDGCKLYFVTDRAGGPGGQDIWEATKPL